LVLNLHEGMACSNTLSNCPVTLMCLQEKNSSEACLVLFLKLPAAYSTYFVMNLCETCLLQRNFINTEKL